MWIALNIRANLANGADALDKLQPEHALQDYRIAALELETEAVRILAAAEDDIAHRAQAAVGANQLDAAEKLLEEGRAVRARKEQVGTVR